MVCNFIKCWLDIAAIRRLVPGSSIRIPEARFRIQAPYPGLAMKAPPVQLDNAMWFISMNHIGTMFFVGGEPMICMHNCTDCKRKLSESGMQRVHVTSCNIRPSSTLARPLAQIYLCRDPNNTASRNTIALVHRSQLLELRTGWPLWTCMSIRRCRSVRRNPVTITIAPRGASTGRQPCVRDPTITITTAITITIA